MVSNVTLHKYYSIKYFTMQARKEEKRHEICSGARAMPGVTKEQIAKARAVDLLAYLQTYEPDVLKRDGHGNYRHKEHDSLVFHNNYWYWNSRGRSINALDYLVEIRGYGLVDAVNTLIDGSARASPSYSAPSAKEKPPPEKKPFRLPWARRCATFMVAYLQRRGIHTDVIQRCMQSGSLYEGRYNGEAVCVFAGRDDAGAARFACVRGIAGDLRKDISGSDKRYSFFYPPEQPGSRQLAVFEAPIDVLSHASLQKLEGWKWNGYRLSLGGTSPVALVAFLERHPEISRVALYLDNDRAGLINARKINKLLRADNRFKHIRVSVNPPRVEGGKDYNDKLRAVIRQRQEENQISRQMAAVSI